ncbi:MAG: hypothetical protein ACOVMO_08200, partial [Caulobacter sp.]
GRGKQRFHWSIPLKSRRLAPPHAVFSRFALRRALTWINPEPEPGDSLVQKKPPISKLTGGRPEW